MLTIRLTVNKGAGHGSEKGARDAETTKDQCEGSEGSLEGFGGRAHFEDEQDCGSERFVAAGAQAQKEGVVSVGLFGHARNAR